MVCSPDFLVCAERVFYDLSSKSSSKLREHFQTPPELVGYVNEQGEQQVTHRTFIKHLMEVCTSGGGGGGGSILHMYVYVYKEK